jgi:hypothetical protein
LEPQLQAVLARLIEIREACEVATSPVDFSINEIVEEIDRLAVECIKSILNV